MEPYVVIDAIRGHFKDELSLEKFRQLRKFRTIHMGSIPVWRLS
jgi:hypothetical protein